MQSPVPALHPKLTAALDAFRADGITLSDAEIVWLAKLREPCDKPVDGGVPWIMGAPLKHGGTLFYPVHRLAESWFLRAFQLLDGDIEAQVAAFLFAHAHAAPGQTTLKDYSGADEIRDAVHEWLDQQAIHDADLPQLSNRLRELDQQSDSVSDPDAPPQADEHEADNLPRFVSVMCRAFPGVQPGYWLTDIPAADARAMLANASGDGGDFATCHQRTRAIGNFLRGVKWMWRLYRGEHH